MKIQIKFHSIKKNHHWPKPAASEYINYINSNIPNDNYSWIHRSCILLIISAGVSSFLTNSVTFF